MKKIIVVMISILFLIIFYKTFVNPPANVEVRTKLELIMKEVKNKGYHPIYFISSGKRNKLYNDLVGGVKDSHHLQGKAIDIMVLDVDGDFDFDDKDISIIEQANNKVQKKYPKLIGGFGTYQKTGTYEFWMIHIDVGGYYKRWAY